MSPSSPNFAATFQIFTISGNRLFLGIDEMQNHVSDRLGERVLFVVSWFNSVAVTAFCLFVTSSVPAASC